MIYTTLQQIYCVLDYANALLRVWLKKEIIRLKLRRRGSFSESTWVSLATRHWLEKDRVKLWLGAPFMAAMVMGSAAQLPEADAALTQWDVNQPVSEMITYTIVPPTNQTAAAAELPVTNLYGVSQGYHAGHTAVDLTAPLGSDVVAMDHGVVTLVEYGTFGYGRRVVVTHENEVQTLYAHLGKVYAQPGEIVAKGDALGEVGMTGWTTGPHLHFEVIENSEAVNPLMYITSAIETYQQMIAEED